MLRPYLELVLHRFRTHRENGHAIERVARALRIEIEAAHRDDLVAPPFDARRRRHAESVDVENSATHTVLGDFSDSWDPLVAHLIEPLHRVGEAPFLFTDCDHESRLLQCRRNCRPLGARSGRGDQHTDRSAQQRLDRLDALAGQFVMRLLGAERLALWIQRRRLRSQERLQIREPALPVRWSRSDDSENTLRQRPGKRCDQHGRARTGKPAHPDALSGRWQAPDERARGGKVVKPLEQKGERHQRVRVATPSSAAASSSARTSRIPLASARRVPEKPSAANRSALSIATRSLPPSAAVTSALVAGVRSDSRASGPKTVAPIVSVPRVRNSTRGAPSAEATSAAPITIRLTSASMNGTNPGVAGNAVQAVSSRLPSTTTLPERTSQGSLFTVATTASARCSPLPAPSMRYRRTTGTPLRTVKSVDESTPGVAS